MNLTFLEGSNNEFSAEVDKYSGAICLFFFSTTRESVTFYCALIKSGCIPLVVSPNASEAYIARLMSLYSPDIYVSNAFRETLGGQKRFEYRTTALFVLDENFSRNVKSTKRECLLLPTSGSTGDPKTVRLTLQNIIAVSSEIANYLRLDPDGDILATTLPPYYSYGLSLIHLTLFESIPLLVSEYKLLSKEYWLDLARNNVTVFSGVPAMYSSLLKSKMLDLIPASISKLTIAGGKLADRELLELIDYCEDKNKEVFVMYGATEAGPRMGFVPPELSRKKLGSAGRALNSGRFSIVNGSEGVGDIIYQGPNVALGYAESKVDVNGADIFRGRLETGDCGYLDDDDFLYITGRKSRMVKIAGLRVNLDQLENSLRQAGIDVALIFDSEKDKIIVYIKNADQKNAVKSQLGEQFEIPLVAILIKVCESFPFLPSGKIDYQNLTDRMD